jgi:hypothetical protein
MVGFPPLRSFKDMSLPPFGMSLCYLLLNQLQSLQQAGYEVVGMALPFQIQ